MNVGYEPKQDRHLSRDHSSLLTRLLSTGIVGPAAKPEFV